MPFASQLRLPVVLLLGRLVSISLAIAMSCSIRSPMTLLFRAAGASFELARRFAHVTGLDYSARFIKTAVESKARGSIRYALPEEGEIVTYHEKSLSEFGLDSARNKVDFFQGDSCSLKTLFTGYDLVLACNLIDRLYDPAKFLATIHERVNEGGLLNITSPYTWLREFTERDKWIGGFYRDGENVTTLQAMTELLSPHFTSVIPPRDIAFVIRETSRKFQHSIAQMTFWERR
jgi:putative 4-mercaptohistidine N1-methyltranferase